MLRFDGERKREQRSELGECKRDDVFHHGTCACVQVYSFK